MDPLKYTYDVLADECLDKLDELCPPSAKSTQPASSSPSSNSTPQESSTSSKPPPTARRDFYALLRDNHTRDPKLHQLWTQLNTIPPWVDWAQIARGQDVLYRYAGAALTGLTFQSLVGGLGAKRIVETLARTGGLSPSAARRRLLQTLQHILQCTRHPDALRPPGSWKEPKSEAITEPSLEIQEDGESGEGFVATVRVRLLHASVRRRILRLEREKPGYFDIDGWGIPVCDLDSAATLASFSASMVWWSLPRQCIWPSEREIEDYIALWRYIGYLLGYPSIAAVERYESHVKEEEEKNKRRRRQQSNYNKEKEGGATTPYNDIYPAPPSTTNTSVVDPDFFASVKRTKAIFESLLLYEVEPTPTSRLLARNILVSLANKPPVHVSVSMLAATTRWLNGGQLSDALGVPAPSPYLYYTALAVGQCCFFAGMALIDKVYTTLSIHRQRAAGMWRSCIDRKSIFKSEERHQQQQSRGKNENTHAKVLATTDAAEITAAVQSGQTGYWFGQTKINRLKIFLWSFVVQSKVGLAGKPTKFDFEFVPRTSSVPSMAAYSSYDIPHSRSDNDNDNINKNNNSRPVGAPSDSSSAKISEIDKVQSNTAVQARRIERRNMRALLIALVFILPLVGFAGWMLGRWAWGVAFGGVFGDVVDGRGFGDGDFGGVVGGLGRGLGSMGKTMSRLALESKSVVVACSRSAVAYVDSRLGFGDSGP